MNTINETAAIKYAKIAGISAAAILLASIPLALAMGFIAGALGYNAMLVGGGIVAGAIVIAALFGYDALRVNRWAFVEQIAAVIAERDANAKRTEAEAARIKAESERILAEADAIDRASVNASQLNLNSGSGKQVIKNQNQPITFRSGGQIVNGVANQLNQTNEPAVRKIEITAADVRWFVEQLATGYGHSKGNWKVNEKDKIELPYSRLPVNYTIYKALIDPLAENDPPAIVGRGDRASGKLVQTDPAELIKTIEQTYPGAGSKGITLELPALASPGN